MLNLSFSSFKYECGTDEAGRGCLAGPVIAASVINPVAIKSSLLKNFEQINDSKKISECNRHLLSTFIKENATAYAITSIEPAVIDKINILNASILAMQNSIMQLSQKPNYIIIDGNRFSEQSPLISLQHINPKKGIFNTIPYQTIIKGDAHYLSIAAASILAKTYRDLYMENIHHEFPMYNWKKNKGYGTKEHREAIKKYGTTKYHRLSFKLLSV